MASVEKNDVDISALFDWGRVYEIVNSEGETEALIYMKLLGDADVNRARVYALRKSAELRRKMRDPDSDEYLTTVRDIDEMSIDDLVQYVVAFSMRDIRNRALKEVKVKKPKPPKSDASLEEVEKFQEDVDAYPEKMQKALEKFMKKEVDVLTKQFKKKDKEELYKSYLKLMTDELCELTATRAYKDMEVYLGCYKDDEYKERFFDSFEEYDNLLSEIKIDIRKAYETLNFPMEELKKLREATQ